MIHICIYIIYNDYQVMKVEVGRLLLSCEVSHCMVYQRQPDVPKMQQMEVFELKGTLGT
jgi:hypothetical protein